MKVQGAWIELPATQAVCSALTARGFQALFVGGCVRNSILNAPVSDIDIATDATPDQILDCAKTAKLGAIPTGIDHGTITVVSGGIAHEITSFRSDIETDGRHAQVRFSTDVNKDAARRDFTMNAIYARADGRVVDPLNGLPDLEARHVRFIGVAQDRITEDYLRSLRFFRFTAWYGDPALGIDPEGLAAVAQNIDGLSGLSRERIGAELKKLLSAPDPAMAVAAMRSAGVLSAVISGADDTALALLVHYEQQLGLDANPLRRLALLAGADSAKELRLSKAEQKEWAVLRDELGSMKTPRHLGYLHGAARALDILLLRAALLETPFDQGAIIDTKKGEKDTFPVKAKDLEDLSGPALGAQLRALEARWIASGFSLSREDLLA